MQNPLRHLFAAGILAGALVAEAAAPAETIVLPRGLDDVEGNRNFRGSSPVRFQQIYPSAQFAGLPRQLRITEIAWRPDGPRATAPRVHSDDVLIRLSTKEGAANLSMTFRDNVGPNPQTVVYDGSFDYVTTNTSSVEGPKPFDYRIPVDPPYLYEPDRGHLLLDFQTLTGTDFFVSLDSDTAVLGQTLLLSFVPEADVADCGQFGCWHGGIVTRITYELPPESDFRRGDCNEDGAVDISDAIFTLGSLFLGQGDPGCDDACDANDDGAVDISDAIAALGVLFLGQGAIPLPGPSACGTDPTGDALDCSRSSECP